MPAERERKRETPMSGIQLEEFSHKVRMVEQEHPAGRETGKLAAKNIIADALKAGKLSLADLKKLRLGERGTV